MLALGLAGCGANRFRVLTMRTLSVGVALDIGATSRRLRYTVRIWLLGSSEGTQYEIFADIPIILL